MSAAGTSLSAYQGQAMPYADYRQLLERCVAERRTTGLDQSDYLVHYTKLNLARTRRMERTFHLAPQASLALRGIVRQSWLVITEVWCGDSAQNLPVLAALAGASPKVELGVLLRDEHIPLMDQYLTNGGRSIPKLIAVDAHGKELFTWGPRPRAAQDLVQHNLALPLAQQAPKEEMAEKLHRWYASNGGAQVQQELLALAAATA
jgi:Thioredoxin